MAGFSPEAKLTAEGEGAARMSVSDKLLAKMRNNPRGSYTITDVIRIAEMHAVSCEKPSGGSHYTLRHERIPGVLTVP